MKKYPQNEYITYNNITFEKLRSLGSNTKLCRDYLEANGYWYDYDACRWNAEEEIHYKDKDVTTHVEMNNGKIYLYNEVYYPKPLQVYEVEIDE